MRSPRGGCARRIVAGLRDDPQVRMPVHQLDQKERHHVDQARDRGRQQEEDREPGHH